MKSPRISTNRGFMLIEIGITLAIFSLSLVAIGSVILYRQNSTTNLELRRKALFTAISNIEMLRAQASTDFLSLANSTSSQNSIDTSISISDINPCIRNATSSASWSTFGKQKTEAFSLLLLFNEYAKAIDNDCGNTLLSSTVQSKQTFPINATSTLIDALHNYLYVAQNTGSSSALAIYKYEENNNLEFISSVPINAQIDDLDATHNYVYLALHSNNNQLVVVDIHDQFNPTILASTTLPRVSGSYPGATSIRFYDNKIFIGTHRTQGHEFHIFDVSSSVPKWLGSIELNHNINHISIRNNFAYLSTSGNTKDLIILDITDPVHIKTASTLELPGSNDSLTHFLIGNKLYVGKKKSTKTSDVDFCVINISSTTAPVIEQTKRFEKNILGITVSDTKAFLLAQDSISTLEILDTQNFQITSSVRLVSPPIAFDGESHHIFITSESRLETFTF